VLLVVIAYALFRMIPELGNLAAGLYDLYREEVVRFVRRRPPE
jgi:exosortase/archaeosortase